MSSKSDEGPLVDGREVERNKAKIIEYERRSVYNSETSINYPCAKKAADDYGMHRTPRRLYQIMHAGSHLSTVPGSQPDHQTCYRSVVTTCT